MRDQIKARPLEEDWKSAEQGFIDQYGDFVTREDALPIARAAGQIRGKIGTKELFSENLY